MLADGQVGGATFLTLRDRSYGIRRERLVQIIEQKELLLSLGPATETVSLLVEPDEDWLRSTAEAVALREYWRLLYQARVHVVAKVNLSLSEQPYTTSANGPVVASADSTMPQRIERIGWSVFNDVRFVLLRERLVLPGASDAEVYARFAAVFLDLYFFAPSQLPRFSAVLEDPRAAFVALCRDVPAEQLLRETRPARAAAPMPDQGPATGAQGDLAAIAALPAAEPPVGRRQTLLERRAAWTASAGNDAHAAILHKRAGKRSRGQSLVREAQANPYFSRFVERLAAVTDRGQVTGNRLQGAVTAGTPSDGQRGMGAVSEWAEALWPVLAHAADRWRNAEGRLLYDLQKVCSENERGIYRLDALRWLLSGGRRPLRRCVPAQAMALTCKHLRAAVARLDKCGLTAAQRAPLEGLLRTAIYQAEQWMRDALRPAVAQSLEQSDLRPHHRVEEVAREKMVEEFLDGLVLRGYGRIGDLRDTLSRNQLKLHDLDGVGTFLRGDQLLQIDRRLSGPLDGVYHAGEAYLRFFQRVSSALFGTRVGRFFTYYGLIPFGGAYLTLEVLGHTIGNLYRKLSGVHIPFNDPAYVLPLGLLFLAVLNVEPFRRGIVQSFQRIRYVFRRILHWRGWRICRRSIEAIMASPAWRFVARYGLKPAIVTFLAWRLMPRGMPWTAKAPTLLAIYSTSALALNSRAFRMSTYLLAHVMGVVWSRVVSDLFTGLYRVVVQVFRLLLDRLERTLYSVDEWFRFRGGQGHGLLIAKATLGAAWGVLAYCVRFAVTLLAEPQINPIKHFPVVTVSHKIILPTVPSMTRALESVGLGKVQAGTYATSIAFVIPGIFGFLAWELKENWRLYAANRSRMLCPVRMGSHGETLAQLLRPGIHSGTIPRIFARVRHMSAEESSRRSEASLHKLQELLDHVSESVWRFLNRELASLLNRYPIWRDTPVKIGAVDLAATKIRVALECPALGEPASLSFEQHDGWVIAGFDASGWMTDLPPVAAQLLGSALLGLYQMAGVDLIREQIERFLGPESAHWMIRDTTLIAWIGPGFRHPVHYSLKPDEDGPATMALPGDGNGLPGAGSEASSQLLVRRRPVSWQSWTRLWDLPPADWDEDLIRLVRSGTSTLPGDCLRPDLLTHTPGHAFG